MALIGNVNQVKTAKDHQEAAYTFDYDSSPGFLVPVHIPLNKLSAGSRRYDNRAMAETINYKQQYAVQKIRHGRSMLHDGIVLVYFPAAAIFIATSATRRPRFLAVAMPNSSSVTGFFPLFQTVAPIWAVGLPSPTIIIS